MKIKYICEKCGEEFSTAKGCKEHEKTHKDLDNVLWRVTGDLWADKDSMVRVEPVPRGNLALAEPGAVLSGSDDWWVNCLKPDILTALQSLNSVVRDNLREEEEALAQKRSNFEEAMRAMMGKYMHGGKA